MCKLFPEQSCASLRQAPSSPLWEGRRGAQTRQELRWACQLTALGGCMFEHGPVGRSRQHSYLLSKACQPRSAAQRATTLSAAHTLLTLARPATHGQHWPPHTTPQPASHITSHPNQTSHQHPRPRDAFGAPCDAFGHTSTPVTDNTTTEPGRALGCPPSALTAGAPAHAALTRALPQPQWAPAQRTGLRARTS